MTPTEALVAYRHHITAEYQARSTYAEAQNETARRKRDLEDRKYSFIPPADLPGKTAAERDEQRKALLWEWTAEERRLLDLSEAAVQRAEATHAYHRHLLTAAQLEVEIAMQQEALAADGGEY